MRTARLRQVVLIAPDLDSALAEAREVFGFTGGVQDVEGMAKLGFAHDVYTFDDTFLEIVAATDPASPQAKVAGERGAGYMTVVQVDDLDGLVERAAGLGFGPVMHEEYDGHMLSQWHPKNLGTLAEFDHISPAETWHFAPGIFENRSTGVARDLAGAVLAVEDPEAMTATWLELTGAPRGEGTSVDLDGGTVRFVPSNGGPRGLREVQVIATDPARVGESVTLCDVQFTFVGENQNQEEAR